MSDLTQTRDHARKMAGRSETSAKDAALWMQIAAEIDQYLHRGEAPDLFGEWTVEPVAVEPEETSA